MSIRKSGYLAISIIFMILAAFNLLSPPVVRPNGEEWGFFGAIWDYLGVKGIFFYWLILGFIFFALFLRGMSYVINMYRGGIVWRMPAHWAVRQVMLSPTEHCSDSREKARTMWRRFLGAYRTLGAEA